MPPDDFPVGRRIDIGLGADRSAGCFVRGGGQGFLPRSVHRTVGRDLDDVPLAGGKALAEKLGQLHLAHKADTLRILLVGRDQPGLGSDAAHLGLEQLADGEHGPGELLLGQLTQEITLVLVGIAAGQQTVHGLPVLLQGSDAGIVPGGYAIGPQVQCGPEEDVEFDLPVAQHIGVGGTSAAVLLEHVIDHPLAVHLAQIDYRKRDVQGTGHEHGVVAVLQPGAFFGDGDRGVVPVFHEQSDDFVALLLEQVRRHRGIHSAGKPDHHPFLAGIHCVRYVFLDKKGPCGY